MGYDNASLFKDPDIVRALQKKLGVKQDGIAGPETIKSFQKHLGVADDGFFGPESTKALQTLLHLTPDGVAGFNTQSAFMGWVGDNGQIPSSRSSRLQPATPNAPRVVFSSDAPTVLNGAQAQSLNNRQSLLDLANQIGGAGGALIKQEAQYLGLDAGTSGGRLALQRAGIATGDHAWCARFKNHCLGEAGMRGTGSAMALSFEQVGVRSNDPRPGDLLILNRGKPGDNKAHIVTFLGFDEKRNPICLGGNQGPNHDDELVSVQTFDRSAVREFRHLPDSMLAQNHRPASKLAPHATA